MTPPNNNADTVVILDLSDITNLNSTDAPNMVEHLKGLLFVLRLLDNASSDNATEAPRQPELSTEMQPHTVGTCHTAQ